MNKFKNQGPTNTVGSGVNSMEREKRILKYLKHQLRMREEELKFYDTPLDPDTLRDIRKMEEVILKNKVSQLRDLVSAIEYMLEEESD